MQWGGDTPSPHPTPRRLRRLDLNPPILKSAYAIESTLIRNSGLDCWITFVSDFIQLGGACALWVVLLLDISAEMTCKTGQMSVRSFICPWSVNIFQTLRDRWIKVRWRSIKLGMCILWVWGQLLLRQILNVAQWGEKTNPHGVAYYLLINFGDWRINRRSPAKNILLIPIRIEWCVHDEHVALLYSLNRPRRRCAELLKHT